MTIKRIIGLLVLPLVLLAAAVALAPAQSAKVVKIGDLGSKVGVFEGYGKYQTMAIQLAVEELNAKGGVLGHKIEVLIEDDETRPAPATPTTSPPSVSIDVLNCRPSDCPIA